MKRTGFLILVVSALATVLLWAVWLAGLVIGETFGGLIHLSLPLSLATILGVIVGAAILVVGAIQKK